MTVASPLALDETLDRCRQAWEALACPAIVLDPCADSAAVRGSRLGGRPALIRGEAWPRDDEGHPMTFLLQVDLKAMPKIDLLPRDGLLQIFLGDDEEFGAGWHSPLDGFFLIRHIPEGTPLVAGQAPEGWTPDFSPVQGEAIGLEGRLVIMQPDAREGALVRSRTPFAEAIAAFRKHTRLADDLEELLDGSEEERPDLWLGGFTNFTRNDPRAREGLEHLVPLLTCDSFGPVAWGDAGVASFLVEPQAARGGDFAGAAYSWDAC
ncbi:DUF1963 domain-containing protein [Cereibacter sphaeroides]|uniref:DUF1963 domain-containing protein n=1 Tax=Cereibacter sphaeroides TaxID=1063 RepID=UPI001F3E7F01|nr:DUF1963 domain-containing protein [Cereibacter sphaeroides]MCE6959309.1 DUF1963 domain-containing protein [Cereibacter sphaeroides]MCE6972901.1 DUF1963 domain-containing protein [Cereibacter sphaeroides]